MTYSAIDLDRVRKSGSAGGVARAIVRQRSPLCEDPGLYLVTPTGWASAVDPDPLLLADADHAMARGGMDILTSVVRRMRHPTAARAMQVRVGDWVQHTWGGRLEPHAATDEMAARVAAVDALGRRIERIPIPRIRALCTSVIRSGGLERLPYAVSAWGRPWDSPGGWVHRALSLIAESERSLPSLDGSSLALVQAALLVSDRPVAVEADPGERPSQRGSAVAAIEDALTRLPALTRAHGLDEGACLRLLQVMVGMVTDEDLPPLSVLRDLVRDVDAERISLREPIPTVGS
jgi:hypothetical protein